MNERRKRIMKRLVIEELERREMLTSATPEILMQASALTTNSLQDFYKSVVGTEIGGPAGVYMLDEPTDLPPSDQFILAVENDYTKPDSAVPDATSGVGQQTITTGANTLGIGSFASPTAGPSRAGGTGNPGSPLIGNLSAADAAMEQLFGDPDAEAVAKTDPTEESPDDAEGAIDRSTLLGSKSTARRAWSISPEEAEAEEAEEAKPEPAGAER